MSEMRPVAVKCKGCGKVFYPERSSCLNCGSTHLEKEEMPEKGRLVTYTKLYAIPLGVSRLPLVLGIVEFDSGLRALGQIEAEGDPQLGMSLRVAWGKLREIGGKSVYGLKFRRDD